MKRRIVLGAILAVAMAFAAIAAGETKLQRIHAAKFEQAVKLLDDYRGNTASLEQARSALDEVLKANPLFAPAHREKSRYFIMRGYINTVRFQPGALEAAAASLDKAIELKPNYAEAYVLRGHLYRLMGRHRDALAALEKAERLGTTDPWLHNNWADLLLDEGKFEAAAARYKKVIEGKTQNKKAVAAAFEGLIRYYRSTRNLDRADEIYRKQIAFEPGSAWSYGNYANFLLCEKDDYENAIVRSRQALKIMDYGNGRYWLAAALYRKWANGVVSGNGDERYFLEAQKFYPDPNRIAAHAANCPPLRFVSQALARSKNGNRTKR